MMHTGRLITLIRPSLDDDGKKRLYEECTVEFRRCTLDVVDIQRRRVRMVQRNARPARRLPNARDTWGNQVPEVLPAFVVPNDHRHLGTRPDRRHISTEHVEELRKLIDRRLAQETAHLGRSEG